MWGQDHTGGPLCVCWWDCGWLIEERPPLLQIALHHSGGGDKPVCTPGVGCRLRVARETMAA